MKIPNLGILGYEAGISLAENIGLVVDYYEDKKAFHKVYDVFSQRFNLPKYWLLGPEYELDMDLKPFYGFLLADNIDVKTKGRIPFQGSEYPFIFQVGTMGSYKIRRGTVAIRVGRENSRFNQSLDQFLNHVLLNTIEIKFKVPKIISRPNF